jgi:hypothetical protein
MEAAFGLQDNGLRAFVRRGLHAERPRQGSRRMASATRQQSRQASQASVCRSQDWWTDGDENVHTFCEPGSAELVTRTVVSLGCDFIGSRAR